MLLFLDSSKVEEIREFLSYNLIKGVTTNPSIIVKDGNKGIESTIEEITDLVSPYPVSVEVTTNEYSSMIQEAEYFSDWKDNIVIKIPVHGPNGELVNLKVINKLYKKQIKVNATCIMNTAQAYAAYHAGAAYVSLFGGRVENMGYSSVEEITHIKKVIDNKYCKLIIGSVREASNIFTWFGAGADIVTVTPDIIRAWLVHPATKEIVLQFLNDAKRITNGK
jgi:transaldolase